jgi:hypothetical protein
MMLERSNKNKVMAQNLRGLRIVGAVREMK